MSRRVLVTAGAQGLGFAMSQAFLAQGCRVMVSDNDATALAALPAGVERVECDAADPDATDRLYAQISAQWGGLDVLCANAGIAGPTALIEDLDFAQWQRCLAVNLDGAMLAARGAARLMKPAGRGVITFTSSTAGLFGYPARAPYVAAKWAIIGLMKTVAMELGPHGIRANAICPGSVEGPRIDRVIAAEAQIKGLGEAQLRQAYAAGAALKRLSRAEDVADMAIFLASDAARMVTGQALAVDGMTINLDP